MKTTIKKTWTVHNDNQIRNENNDVVANFDPLNVLSKNENLANVNLLVNSKVLYETLDEMLKVTATFPLDMQKLFKAKEKARKILSWFDVIQ